MKYEIEISSRFKKDYKLAKKRGYDLSLLRKELLAWLTMYRNTILII